MAEIKRNERDWAGQLINWLKEAISKGTTSFEDATNDTGLRSLSGRTKFPDILLFSNKISGIVFNGWELKFPDTPVDDVTMLENALEKARRLQSDSFVTWNGSEAIIWKVDTSHYTVDTLVKLRYYPGIPTIRNREDLSNPLRYASHEAELKCRAMEILHDLDKLRRDGQIKEAINISGNISEAVLGAQSIIVPQFASSIKNTCDEDSSFRRQYNKWKIYESGTLNILESSSRRSENVDAAYVLARFTFFNLIGKILFYLTLSENLPKELPALAIDRTSDLKSQLFSYFSKAKSIDYQAVFMPYFTDSIYFSDIVDKALYELLSVLTEFDFKILPSEVIGTILENLVPKEEKQKFGQYFTPEHLAEIVAFPTVKSRHSLLFDPTSGTGTFLNVFYNILKFFGNSDHQQILSQIWGNDISHFPAILSVINLYKQDVTQTENFPRVMRDDYFNLSVGDKVRFPAPRNHNSKIEIDIPKFDGIASNFPFIQQEDIPKEKLNELFRQQFGLEQSAFSNEGSFFINERSDYFTYCVYNSLQFLNDGGVLSAITSNAWLGKAYGTQFKRFLLSNFHIKYVVRSTAEHWFSDSKVSTVFFVLEKSKSGKPTKFVSFNFKLADFLGGLSVSERLNKIEDLYAQIDYCDEEYNRLWVADSVFKDVYHKTDGTVDVSIISRDMLVYSLSTESNWAQFFTAANPLKIFEPFLIRYNDEVFNVIRGERTGWNEMFVIRESKIHTSGIASKYLVPYIKSPDEFSRILFEERYKYNIFVCSDAPSSLDDGTRAWILRFENMPNKNGSKTIAQANAHHKPYWYSLSPKAAHIVTAINPYERLFFSYSPTAFVIDQRMIAMQVQDNVDIELIAALLNSVATLLSLEYMGTSRHLGALDLNADFLKNIRLLNPGMLSGQGISEIKSAFRPLCVRDIGTVVEECGKADRIKFDKVVLRAFGIDESILDSIYSLLCNHVNDRVSMRNK